MLTGIDFRLSNHNPKTIVSINSKKYFFNKVIISVGKDFENSEKFKKDVFDLGIRLMLVFLIIKKIIIKQHMRFLRPRDH